MMSYNTYVEQTYREMYPELFKGGLILPMTGFTLDDVALRPVESDVAPHEVDLTSSVGPLTLPFPVLGAAMDTVSGPNLAKALSDIGGAAVIYRDPDPEYQRNMLEDALSYRHGLIANPVTLLPDETLGKAWKMFKQQKIKTFPVVTKQGLLVGVLFVKQLAFEGRSQEPVSNWMLPLEKLKIESPDSTYTQVRDRLLSERECTVLPVMDGDNVFHGMYFKKDFFRANPSIHNGKPVVGMAVGVGEEDLDRVREGLKLGVGIIIIDSSHGNCTPVITQSERIMRIVGNQAAVIAGNVADIGGYYALAEVGVHAVKAGIGPGAGCTTSQGTGAGFPMHTLLQELDFIRRKMNKASEHAPKIVADGGISGPGHAAKALGAGGDLIMAGVWLVPATESRSVQKWGLQGLGKDKVLYRGMASREAIDERMADRYDGQKRAPEGKSGYVDYKGPLRSWIHLDVELMKGGFAHVGAANLNQMHEKCRRPWAWSVFTGTGQKQISVRLEGVK